MLIAVGDRYDRLVGWSALTTSIDGEDWSYISSPFDIYTKCTGVARGPDRVIVVGDAGQVAMSIDLYNWDLNRLWYGNFQPLSIQYATNKLGNNGIYLACGQGKFPDSQGAYPALSEVGQIFRNISGDSYTWELIYNYEEIDSRFYNVRRLKDADDVWIACGNVGKRPLVIYSLDNANSWTELELPTELGTLRYAYDAAWTNDTFYITVNGYILSTPSLTEPNWDASQEIIPQYGKADIKKIAVNPAGHLVSVCSGGILWSTDGVGWNLINVPGYRFVSIIWYNDRWIAGTETYLTEHTYWTSTDTINWQPENNGVHMNDFDIVN